MTRGIEGSQKPAPAGDRKRRRGAGTFRIVARGYRCAGESLVKDPDHAVQRQSVWCLRNSAKTGAPVRPTSWVHREPVRFTGKSVWQRKVTSNGCCQHSGDWIELKEPEPGASCTAGKPTRWCVTRRSWKRTGRYALRRIARLHPRTIMRPNLLGRS